MAEEFQKGPIKPPKIFSCVLCAQRKVKCDKKVCQFLLLISCLPHPLTEMGSNRALIVPKPVWIALLEPRPSLGAVGGESPRLT